MIAQSFSTSAFTKWLGRRRFCKMMKRLRLILIKILDRKKLVEVKNAAHLFAFCGLLFQGHHTGKWEINTKEGLIAPEPKR